MPTQHGPFSLEEGTPLETPLEAARVASEYVLFSFRVWEAASNGFLLPETFGSEVSLGTGTAGVRIREEYSPIEVKKWAWNSFLAGIGISALAMDRALDDALGLPRPLDRHPYSSPASLSERDTARVIIYMIRCAFAHDPFNPKWECQQRYRDVFRVPCLGLEVDTRLLNGRILQPKHFGGMPAYLQLLFLCCDEIEKAGQGRQPA